MQSSAQGIASLEHEEGVVLRAYRCPAGVWTIGAGLTGASGVVKPRAGMVISKSEATSLLQKALRGNYEPAVGRAMPGAKQHEFDAGIGFHFNTGAIGRASWVKAWREKTGRAAIVKRLFLWKKGGGKVLPGLVKRRAREAEMLFDAKYPVAIPSGQKSFVVTLNGSAYLSATWSVPMNHAEGLAAQQGFRTLGFDAGNIAAVIPVEAVYAFQRQHGLTVDGIIGRATLSTLQRMLDARARAPVAVAAPAAASVATGTDTVGGLTGLPYADLAALGLGLVFAVSVAFTYRDAIAAAAHDRFPRVAGWLRSF